MDWQALSAISEIIAAIAVVVSVVYLARQIRSSATSFNSDIRNRTFFGIAEWNYNLYADPDLPLLFQRAVTEFPNLDPKERARAIHVFYGFFKIFENMYLNYLEGSIDEAVWHKNWLLLSSYTSQPGARHYFSERKELFDERFQALLLNHDISELTPAYAAFKLGESS